jgi:hypothetical protein
MPDNRLMGPRGVAGGLAVCVCASLRETTFEATARVPSPIGLRLILVVKKRESRQVLEQVRDDARGGAPRFR